MRIFKKIVCILAVVIVFNSILAFALTQPSYFRVVLHEVQQKNVNYDLIFLGQSHGENAFAPDILKETTGMETYNLCRRLITVQDIYYLLKESNYKNNPKVVVMDLDQTYWMDNVEPNYYSDSFIYPHLNNPINKMEYFFNDNLKLNYNFTLFRYHICGKDDIKKILPNLKAKCTPDYFNYSMDSIQTSSDIIKYKGKGFRFAEKRNGKDFEPTVWNSKGVKEKPLKYLKKMAQYCNKEGIQFICVSSPVPAKRLQKENHDEMNEYFAKLAEEGNFLYLDFNYIKNEYLQWNDDDFVDGDGHMMGKFAERYSKVLGNVINDYKDEKDISHYFNGR